MTFDIAYWNKPHYYFQKNIANIIKINHVVIICPYYSTLSLRGVL